MYQINRVFDLFMYFLNEYSKWLCAFEHTVLAGKKTTYNLAAKAVCFSTKQEMQTGVLVCDGMICVHAFLQWGVE